MIIPFWKLWTVEVRNNSKHLAQGQIKSLRENNPPSFFSHVLYVNQGGYFSHSQQLTWVHFIWYLQVYGSWVIWNKSSKPQIKGLQMQYQNHILYRSVLFSLKTRVYAFSGSSVFLGDIYLWCGNILALVGYNL